MTDSVPRLIDDAEFDAWLEQNQDVKDWIRDGGILRRDNDDGEG